jgi:agmatinase
MPFDPDAAAVGGGLYGLPFTTGQARFVVIPVPFDATTSYRDGACDGPAAVLEASRQVDLFDLDFGRPWEPGIAMLALEAEPARTIARLNRRARRLALPVIAAGGGVAGKPRLERALAEVNRICSEVNELVYAAAKRVLDAGRTPVVLGGDHATPFGAIRAVAERHPGLGVLHIDAHADLRDAYEGFAFSHASIMHNVVHRIGRAGGVAKLVQAGIRDLGEAEHREITRKRSKHETAVVAFFDPRLWAQHFAGRSFAAQCKAIVAELPREVYLSVDIDGLDPGLCPDTGTPVPGGFSFPELVELLRALVASKRRVVGLDLNEVAPSPRAGRDEWAADWNANVGARVLYKLIGAAGASVGGAGLGASRRG